MLRKIYALINTLSSAQETENLWQRLNLDQKQQLQSWWDNYAKLSLDIASSSDRVNLEVKQVNPQSEILIKHPISGQQQYIDNNQNLLTIDNSLDLSGLDEKKLFWWLWRFLPELRAKQPESILTAAHLVLPDCPLHSYAATTSALVGAMYPQTWQEGNQPEYPYLVLFTFSPVQEFIKASRKFVDFWAGSYLLHYLGGTSIRI